MIIIAWLFFSILVAFVFGSARQIGWFLSLVVCLLLSPLIGFIITICSKTKETAFLERQQYEINKKKLEQLKQPVEDLSSKLEKIAHLKSAGHLTDEEYQQAKQKLLNSN